MFQGNIGYGETLTNESWTSSEFRNVNPLLTTNPLVTTVNGLQLLLSTSPAINAAESMQAYVAEGMDGQLRSTAAIANRPLSLADVGPNAP